MTINSIRFRQPTTMLSRESSTAQTFGKRRSILLTGPRRSLISAGAIKELNRSQPPAAAEVHRFPIDREDKIFERFEECAFGKWVTQGAAFGDQTVNGAADSEAPGPTFSPEPSPRRSSGQARNSIFTFGSVGPRAIRQLKERGPLRFTIVADGYKGQHIVPDGGAIEMENSAV